MSTNMGMYEVMSKERRKSKRRRGMIMNSNNSLRGHLSNIGSADVYMAEI